MATQKTLVVGRHAPDLGSAQVEVVEQKNVLFPATGDETLQVLRDLEVEAANSGATAVLLQNTPGQVSAALAKYIPHAKLRWGVIVSKPAPGPAGVQTNYEFSDEDSAQKAMAAIKAANPRANVELNENIVQLTVDPPRKFEFDHIEWFNSEVETEIYIFQALLEGGEEKAFALMAKMANVRIVIVEGSSPATIHVNSGLPWPGEVVYVNDGHDAQAIKEAVYG